MDPRRRAARRPPTSPPAMSAPARFGQYLYSNITNAIFGTTPTTEDEEPSTSRVPMPGQFEPFLADVLEAKNDLHTGLKIPIELVDAILDFAEYWPHTTTVRRSGEMTIRTGRGHREEEFIVCFSPRIGIGARAANVRQLRSYPLGYLPQETDKTDCRMLDESSFPTIDPQPWTTTKPLVEGTANEEVRAVWLEQSQMKSEYPCRKIVFTIKSHDQGWGGGLGNKGTYNGSYTWFDAGKEELVAFKQGQEPSTLPSKSANTIDVPTTESDTPITCTFHTTSPPTESNQTSSDDTDIKYHFHHAFEPNDQCLQKNRTAEKTMQTHQIVWSCDDDIDPDSVFGQGLIDAGRGRATGTGEFVRNMRIGDVVTVWAKARFAAWCNVVEEVKIDVYWAV